MRVLAQTMTTGGFLTPSLYITKDVWTLSGVKFSVVREKVAALETLREVLTTLTALDPSKTPEVAQVRQFRFA